jgi:uncharacterized cofD-like protein
VEPRTGSGLEGEAAPARPRAVALGGGTGLPAVLRGLRGRAELTAVATVADDGGSSGRLRREGRAALAPGDLRNCLVALAADDAPLAALFQYRFGAPSALEGHSLGNLVLAALADREGSLLAAIDCAARLLGAAGRVLPATLEPSILEADLASGATIRGEAAISASGEAKREVRLVRLGPNGAPAGRPGAAPGVVEAIAAADLVVLGPGSLYTSVIPALLPAGAAAALTAARGLRVLVANLFTEPGETDGLTLDDHLAALDAHAGGRAVDVVLAHGGPLPEDALERALEAGARPLAPDPAAVARRGATLALAPLVASGPSPAAGRGFLRHDPARLGEALLALLARGRPLARPAGWHRVPRPGGGLPQTR